MYIRRFRNGSYFSADPKDKPVGLLSEMSYFNYINMRGKVYTEKFWNRENTNIKLKLTIAFPKILGFGKSGFCMAEFSFAWT
jgi:hypothetical protein